MPRPIHFEIQVNDPEKSAKFYGDVFGWKFQKWEGPEDYWMIFTGDKSQPGIDGGMMKSRGLMNTVNTMDVSDLDQSMKTVAEAGGEIVVPRMAVPGVGWLAYGKDLDGNIFGMIQTDPDAK